MKTRILLTGGGTAGSVTPLLALAEELRRQHPAVEFLFLGTAEGPERALVEAANIPFRTIPGGKLRRYWSWKNFTDLGRLWQGFRRSRQLIGQWKPQVVVSAGSYVAVPVVLAARLADVKIMIHQQDVRPGLANRLIAPLADRITVSFERSLRHFPSRKTRWTGNPVRPAVLQGSAVEARRLFELPPRQPVLLIIGGGTGASYLNHICSAAAYKLVRRWSVIHVTGPLRDFPELRHEQYRLYPFLTWQLPHALAVADLVITRAGLGAFTELAALAKAAIFVPMPSTHQEENAQLIREAKAGIVVDQRQFDQSRLLALTDRLHAHPEERRELGERLHRFYRPEALVGLTGEVSRLASL